MELTGTYRLRYTTDVQVADTHRGTQNLISPAARRNTKPPPPFCFCFVSCSFLFPISPLKPNSGPKPKFGRGMTLTRKGLRPNFSTNNFLQLNLQQWAASCWTRPQILQLVLALSSMVHCHNDGTLPAVDLGKLLHARCIFQAQNASKLVFGRSFTPC